MYQLLTKLAVFRVRRSQNSDILTPGLVTELAGWTPLFRVPIALCKYMYQCSYLIAL